MPDAFAHCEELVRVADQDRFLASLFAPAEHRGALFALYAFNVEVSRVREAVREPLAGEIRLQWWRDVLAGEGRGEVAANPVAAALAATIARYRLPVERLAARDRGAPARSPRRAGGDARRLRSLCRRRLREPDRAGGANSRPRSHAGSCSAHPACRSRPCDRRRAQGVSAGLPRAGSVIFRSRCWRGTGWAGRRSRADRRRRNCALRSPSCVFMPAVISTGRGRWCAKRRPRSCPRCCRSRWCGRRSPAWSAPATIRSCRSSSRPGGGNG